MSEWADDCQQWRGSLLTGRYGHWCHEWDGLPIDETCLEWPCCDVAYRTFPRKLKKWAVRQFQPRRNDRLVKRFHRICIQQEHKVFSDSARARP